MLRMCTEVITYMLLLLHKHGQGIVHVFQQENKGVWLVIMLLMFQCMLTTKCSSLQYGIGQWLQQ